MVTTLKHQTQGETWEDFMRISGSKMNLCASSKTQGAQWCDAFNSLLKNPVFMAIGSEFQVIAEL
jgi:hypothetical protein